LSDKDEASPRRAEKVKKDRRAYNCVGDIK
jgi:hypothetical protein